MTSSSVSAPRSPLLLAISALCMFQNMIWSRHGASLWTSATITTEMSPLPTSLPLHGPSTGCKSWCRSEAWKRRDGDRQKSTTMPDIVGSLTMAGRQGTRLARIRGGASRAARVSPSPAADGKSACRRVKEHALRRVVGPRLDVHSLRLRDPYSHPFSEEAPTSSLVLLSQRWGAFRRSGSALDADLQKRAILFTYVCDTLVDFLLGPPRLCDSSDTSLSFPAFLSPSLPSSLPPAPSCPGIPLLQG